jgi:4-hydroxy-tetrahydrodipicolinate synthase
MTASAEPGVALQGVVPVLPTPFRADEGIDFAALAGCARFASACGLAAVCLPAYASEFYKLTEAERLGVVETALEAADGRIAVIAQANHPAAREAAGLARRYATRGADLVAFAIPRHLALPEADLFDYCRRVCDAVDRPVLIQDYHPNGPTVSVDFVRALSERQPNFRYLKLEEPLLAAKVLALRSATAGRVGVLSGWGGMYLLELLPAGLCGLMPGLGAADLLQRVWQLGRAGRLDEALDLYQVVLPQIVFALQNLELFLRLEKNLLAARGVLPQESTYVRAPTWTPDPETLQHGLRLNRRVVQACVRGQFDLRQPLSGSEVERGVEGLKGAARGGPLPDPDSPDAG